MIAIGNVVADFLKEKPLCERVEKVLHYSPGRAATHRCRKIEPWRKHFPEFSRSVDKDADAFKQSIKEVLHDADMDSYIEHRPKGGKLNESRKKLMFYYKNRFSELRDESRIVLDFESR